MVENMVSQPATTKEMAVCARRYGSLLNQTILFFTKTYSSTPPPALSLSLPSLLSISPTIFYFAFSFWPAFSSSGEEMYPEKSIPHGGIEPLISG
jgi:hypothetical protein